MKVLIVQSCPTLCDSMGCSLQGSSVHGILQARILEWVTIPSPKGSSQPGNQAQGPCTAGRFLPIWATYFSFTYSETKDSATITCCLFLLSKLLKNRTGKDSCSDFITLNFYVPLFSWSVKLHIIQMNDHLCRPLLLLHRSFPALGSFLRNTLFPSCGQSIGASASVFPINIQDWFPLGWTGWISLQSKGLWRMLDGIFN